jgi:hypothetical protein
MSSFKLEKQSKSSVAGVFFFTLVLGFFFRGAWLATAISGIVWLVMTLRKKDSI